MNRLLGSLIVALALAGPVAASAQAAPAGPPDSLSVQTSNYFDAIAHGNGDALSSITTNTFHVIQPDGKVLDYGKFIEGVSKIYFTASSPSGNSQRIKSTVVTANGARETVDSMRWYYGAINVDPIGRPGRRTRLRHTRTHLGEISERNVAPRRRPHHRRPKHLT